jgi:TolB protein
MIAPKNDLDHARLFKIHPDGKGQTELSSACTGDCQSDGFPNWSPSGKRIPFQRVLSSDPTQPVGFIAIFVMRADGTEVRQITQLSADSSEQARFADEAPSWAPDRSHLAFERFSESKGTSCDLYGSPGWHPVRRITP